LIGSLLAIGLSTQLLTGRPLADHSVTGLGLSATYEFILKPRFSLGINLAYRYYPGTTALHQLGYGLLIKHYFQDPQEGWRPFIEYGLLMQVNRFKGRPNAGLSHDTRFSAGTDFTLGDVPMYMALSYHVSRLGFFEQSSLNLDNLELTFGFSRNF